MPRAQHQITHADGTRIFPVFCPFDNPSILIYSFFVNETKGRAEVTATTTCCVENKPCSFRLERMNAMRMFEKLVNFVKDEDGPTAVEYAVMLALIVVVCITAITALGTAASNTFNNTATRIGGS
jgi:pilus assembly protein Flp/PilA